MRNISDYLEDLALFKLLASKLCRKAKVVFVVCDLGLGDDGKAMTKRLGEIFPAGAILTIPQSWCGFKNGVPYETTRPPNPKPIKPL